MSVGFKARSSKGQTARVRIRVLSSSTKSSPFLFMTMSASLATDDDVGSPIKELSGTCEPSCCTLSLSTVNPTS